jgi:membrane protease subunit HflC
MKNLKFYLLGFVGFLLVVLLIDGAYIIDETEQAIITQFGEPVGTPKIEAGLYFKIPFIQKVHKFEKRLLEWDGDPNQIPTLDKKYIWVDTFARWRIADPLKFYQAVRTEAEGQARLDDIIDSFTRDQISSHLLIEVVRNSNRKMQLASQELQAELEASLEKVREGREKLTRKILEQASKLVPVYGIELVDVRIKRVNYVKEVREKVYDRMISERKRIAEKYRSEGMGAKAEIEGRMQKELQRIRSEAYRKAQEIKGKADAEATRIYAEAYGRDPEFYSFLMTLETYKETLKKNSRIIISTDSDFYKYLKKIRGR